MITISKTDALIGINTTNAKISMRQPRADFELAINDPKVEINTEQILVQIDQQQCFNEAGLKDYKTLRSESIAEAKQAALEGIARRVDEGNRMADIKNSADAVAEIAFNNSFDQHVFDVVSMPKSRPLIDFVGGTVDITVHEGTVALKSKPNRPIIDVQAGDVEIFLRQKPEISFKYTGNKVDEIV